MLLSRVAFSSKGSVRSSASCPFSPSSSYVQIEIYRKISWLHGRELFAVFAGEVRPQILKCMKYLTL